MSFIFTFLVRQKGEESKNLKSMMKNEIECNFINGDEEEDENMEADEEEEDSNYDLDDYGMGVEKSKFMQ
jgi:hypothetical protein